MLAVAVVLAWCATHRWGAGGLLFLAPAVLLGCALHSCWYPGERFVLASASKRRARWSRPPAAAPIRRRALLAVPRGGLLLARSLAVRPPPALGSAS
jgi:hypothetical protein